MRTVLPVACFICLIVTGVVFAQQPAQLLAFPGAEGYARFSAGGHGGQVYHVTTLEDSGPGSLRDAVGTDHRIVIFDVGGYIMLKSVLKVGNNITIAGQSAPGEGVGIGGAEVSLSPSHDVVIRYVRIRQGLSTGEDKKSAVNITGGNNIMLDHVTVNWGRWDTIDMNMSENVTIQNCLIGEGVDPQRFGCLCQCDGVTFSHNLFINNQSRNPKAKGKIQYINNVVYNWGVDGLVGGHSAADHTLDVIGNYFIKGPDSNDHFLGEFTPTDHVYQTGNFAAVNRDGKLSGRPVAPEDFGSGANAPTLMPSGAVAEPAPVTIDTAAVAYDKAVSGAGDSLRRDDMDKRLVAELTSLGKDGKIIHDPAVVGGFGKINGGTLPAESLGDGIPDDWKIAHGLDAHDPAVASRLDKDGYTMLEEYLNSAAIAK